MSTTKAFGKNMEQSDRSRAVDLLSIKRPSVGKKSNHKDAKTL